MKRTEKWRVKLKAEPDLLEKLSKEFGNPDLHIFQDSDCWFLGSTYLDSEEHSEIYTTGEKLIDYLNQTLWLYAYRLNQIKSDGYYSQSRTGEWVNKFLAIGRAIASTMLIVHSNDTPDRKSFDVFVQNWKVKEALALFTNAQPDWITLFKIYETARDDEPDIPTTSDGIALIKKWAGEIENKRFFDTANWHRHSVFGKTREKLNEPPDHPMSLSEGQQFIRKLLIAWLEYKSSILRPKHPDQ